MGYPYLRIMKGGVPWSFYQTVIDPALQGRGGISSGFFDALQLTIRTHYVEHARHNVPYRKGGKVKRNIYDSLDKIYWLIDTPSSAERIARYLCISGVMRSVRLPLNFFNP